MAKANSFKSEPWTALEKGTYSIFTDDFVNDKLLTIKATKKSDLSTISLKETLTQREGRISTAEEIKVWFPFKGTKTLYLTLKKDGQKNDSFKLHYDNGVINHHEYLFNFYASVQGHTVVGDRLIYKAGLQTRHNDFAINWRLRHNPVEPSVSLSNKISKTTKCGWNFGLVNSFNLTRKFWNNSAFQISKSNENCDYYLRGSAGKKYERVNFLEHLTFNIIHKYNETTKLGVQVQADIKNNIELNNAAFIWEKKCSELENTAIKVKGDIKRNLNFSVKNNLKGYGNYIFGVGVKEFGGANTFSYGIQLDLNL